GQRHHALLRLARRAPRQRPARHDGKARPPRALPAPAQRPAREFRHRRLLLGGRASRRRHGHGGADPRRAHRGTEAPQGRTSRRLDPDAPRSWPGHPRRPQPTGAAGLSGDRPAQGACRASRHHHRAFPPVGRIGDLMARLTSLDQVSPGVALPRYRPGAHGCGIVHIGVGAFHRAHQAVYTDDALAAEGGDWRIIGICLRSMDIADALNAQNGLYTLIVRDAAGDRARVMGSIAHVVAAAREPGAALAALTDPGIRIVTITVTEKAYGIARGSGVDESNPAIAADLASPRAPVGVIGLLVEALRLRRQAGTPPFTVLCCDNLPDNGTLLAQGVTDFARRLEPELARWIEAEVAFPSCMVDRITPASTNRTYADAERMTGCADQAAVESEPFSQWVIEDRFPTGRPAW